MNYVLRLPFPLFVVTCHCAAITLFSTPSFASGAKQLKETLRRGKVVAVSENIDRASGIAPGLSMIVIKAPPEHVYRITKNVASYQYFMPKIKKSRKLSDSLFELRARIPLVKDTMAKIKVKMGKRGKVWVISWKMVEGSLKRFKGAAWIQRWQQKDTLLRYRLFAVPKVHLMSAVVTEGLRSISCTIVRALKKRSLAKLKKSGKKVALFSMVRSPLDDIYRPIQLLR